MRVWNAFPMLRLIIPIVLGVVGAAFGLELYPIEKNHFLGFGLIILTFLLAMIVVGRKSRKLYLFGMLLWPCLFMCGGILVLSVSDHLYPDDITEMRSEADASTYLIRIVDQPQEKERSVKVIAEVVSTDLNNNGKVMLYFKKDSLGPILEYGNILAVNSQFQKVKGMGNPNEFNYARYLRFHNILFRGYVDSENWKFLSEGKPSLTKWFLRVRSQLISKLEAAGLQGNELAVASALILGYRLDLDRELMTSYAEAGATHVLAVSGLHVGIVYVILNMLLKFMDRSKKTRVLKTIILILCLFGYAGLTGLSASVFRAATMFSFVAAGKMIDRSTNIFNTLAASALCLILYDPMIVTQVGFQLSYAAVIGIVLIQPRLFKLISFNNRIVDWAWSITCVSIAAQLVTFPLALLYFHQFPNLFLISNLLVIPAAAVILYLGFLLFMFSFWEPTLLFFGFLLDSLIELLNSAVSLVDRVPHAVLSGIDISVIEALLIYGILTSFLYFIFQRKFSALRTSLILTVILLGFQITEQHDQKNQKSIALYNVRGETAIALVEGENVTFLSSKELWEDEQRMLFHVRHHWWNKGVEKEHFVALGDDVLNREIRWNGVVFSVLDYDRSGTPKLMPNSKLCNDFVVLHDLNWKDCGDIAQLQTQQLYVSNKLGHKTESRLKARLSDTSVSFMKQPGAVVIH